MNLKSYELHSPFMISQTRLYTEKHIKNQIIIPTLILYLCSINPSRSGPFSSLDQLIPLGYKLELDDNLRSCAGGIFYTNVCLLNGFNISKHYNL